MKRQENPKFNAKEDIYVEKKRKGPEAKLKRLRNQKSKLSEERELLDKCDGLATAAGTTHPSDFWRLLCNCISRSLLSLNLGGCRNQKVGNLSSVSDTEKRNPRGRLRTSQCISFFDARTNLKCGVWV